MVYNCLRFIYNFCKYLNYDTINEKIDEELLELEYDIANN